MDSMAPPTEAPGSDHRVVKAFAGQTTYTLTTEARRKLIYHPAANVFPMIDPESEEFAEFLADVKANGLREPILLCDNRTKIIDGRNRLEMCERANTEPRFADWVDDGRGAMAFVLSRNLHRRHLTPSQRAAIAVAIKEELQRERMARTGSTTMRQHISAKMAEGRTAASRGDGPPMEKEPKARDVAAAAVGVDGRSVDRAAEVKREDPALFERVKDGEITVADAKARIDLGPEWAPILEGKDQKHASSDARRLVREAPDLAAKVLGGELKLYAAKALLDKRQGKLTNADRKAMAKGKAPALAPPVQGTPAPASSPVEPTAQSTAPAPTEATPPVVAAPRPEVTTAVSLISDAATLLGTIAKMDAAVIAAAAEQRIQDIKTIVDASQAILRAATAAATAK